MAKETITVTIRVRLPWWWRLYVYAVKFSHDCGVIEADPEVVGNFISRHTKIIAVPRG